MYHDMIKSYFWISMIFKWLVSKTPYLIHDTTKAPHVTGSGVLLVVDGLVRMYHFGYLNHGSFDTS